MNNKEYTFTFKRIDGSDPADPDDGGDPANCVTVKFTVGDPSSSQSERWDLHLTNDSSGKTRHVCNLGYGTVTSVEHALVKGKSYTFKLAWTDTNLSAPDYDWQLLINDSTATGLRQGLYGRGIFIVEDDGLLTHLYNGDDVNMAKGKTGKIYVPKVKLNLLWETGNKANQIFNPTRRDDKSSDGYQEYDGANEALYGIPRNALYLVGDITDGKFKVSLDLDIQPEALRGRFVCAAFDQNGSKVNGSDMVVPANPAAPVVMEIPAPSTAEVVTYEIRVGMDLNDNGLLDSNEGEPLFVYHHPESNQPQYASIKGITKEKYTAHTNALAFFLNPTIAGIPVDPGPPSLIAKHARTFLYVFYDGTLNMVSNELKPTVSGDILIDAFADGAGVGNCYAEWLTHNSGASFSADGIAAIPLHEWSALSAVSVFLSNRTPFVLKKLTLFPAGGYMETATGTGGALRTFYESEAQAIAETLLANEPIGAEIVMPRDNPADNEDWYCFPRAGSPLFVSESPSWVPGSTLCVGIGDAYGGKWGAFLGQYLGGSDSFDEYDAAGTIGRGRILNPRYQFTVKKVQRGVWPFQEIKYEVVSAHFECVLEDLYDFSYEDSELASHAAALQIGYGRGTGGRENGMIWRNRIIIQRSYLNPFEYSSFIPPP